MPTPRIVADVMFCPANRWRIMVACMLWLLPHHAAQAQEPVAIIVNPSNTMSNVTMDGLRRLYLGRTTAFPDRTPVQLLESSGLRERFYTTVLGMTGDRVTRHWIGLVFAGEASSPPRDRESATELVRLVAATKGAIAFVPASAANATVTVLPIDGKRPGHPSYSLR